MKLIKKIAAIMFAFMMVFALSSNVNAETVSGGDSPQNGSITIKNAEKKHTYTIYRILALDSYSYEKTEANTKKDGNYSYSLIGNGWDNFIRDNSGADKFFTITDGKYVTFNEGKSVEDLAKKAIAYANNSANNITDNGHDTKNGEEEVKFENLPLGYYLIDSSMGALCSLDTTNRDATVIEKNKVPTLVKQVKIGEKNYNEYQYANIGDTLNFKIEIDVKSGVENYVLHDKMDEGLTLDKDSFQITKNNENLTNLMPKFGENGYTFEIDFSNEQLKESDKITVLYNATLNEKAYIGFDNNNVYGHNKNTAKLSYGNSQETVDKTTVVYTGKIPVFKFTKSGNDKTPLKDATFTLSTDPKGESKISFVNIGVKNGYDVYRKAVATDKNSTSEITTTDLGKFVLQGLDGTYYLTEIKAPKGYNQLSEPIQITIGEQCHIIKNQETIDPETQDVEVENNSGKLLPITGGMGTTLIYLVGGALVLGSGFVLANKKRAKAK